MTWVNPPLFLDEIRLFNRKMSHNSQKNESILDHFQVTKLKIITCHIKVILEWLSSDMTLTSQWLTINLKMTEQK